MIEIKKLGIDEYMGHQRWLVVDGGTERVVWTTMRVTADEVLAHVRDVSAKIAKRAAAD